VQSHSKTPSNPVESATSQWSLLDSPDRLPRGGSLTGFRPSIHNEYRSRIECCDIDSLELPTQDSEEIDLLHPVRSAFGDRNGERIDEPPRPLLERLGIEHDEPTARLERSSGGFYRPFWIRDYID
jgi:hypothetical protein